MDLRLFLAVLRRFKKLVLGGFVLAILLAILTYGTPALSHGKPTLIPRGSETWQSQAKLIITEASFPYGRAAQQYTGGSSKTGAPAVPVGDQAYMAGLAPIYAALANGDAIQARVKQAARVPGTVTASQVTDLTTQTVLPFVNLTATAATSRNAVKLAQQGASVLIAYVTQQQTAAGIAPSDRVALELVQNGQHPQLISAHKTSIPLLVFVAVLGAALALACVLENAQPRTAIKLGRVPAEDFAGDKRRRATLEDAVAPRMSMINAPDLRLPHDIETAVELDERAEATDGPTVGNGRGLRWAPAVTAPASKARRQAQRRNGRGRLSPDAEG